MHKTFLKFIVPALVLSMLSISAPVAAEKGGGNSNADQHSHSKGKKKDKSKNSPRYRDGNNHINHNFDDRQRAVVHAYFGPRFQSGLCPPGLAKKYNGCVAPGQAKKWRMGYPLPSGVTFYDLPPHLIGRLGEPGPGYRYVRVAADILLIAVATGMVIDAIEDLNSM